LNTANTTINLTDPDNDAVYTGSFIVNMKGDGSKTLIANVTDELGNSFYPNTTVILDNTAPTASIVINDGDNFTTSRDVWLTLTFDDANGVKECRYGNFEVVEIWNRSDGDVKTDIAYGVAVDSNNNVIVTGGSYLGENYDYYTIKYDPNGNVIWNRTYDGESQDHARGVAVDSNNNVLYNKI